MQTMRALTVQPGVPNSLQLEEFSVPGPERGSVLIRGVALGVCGTDRDIIAGAYGAPPPGHKRLIIGHESLGRVEEAPPASGFRAGDLVMGVVRTPDPVPCENCRAGEWDMCRNGLYTEHGIKSLDGFGSEWYRLAPEYVVRVEQSLGVLGVLTEPTSILAKAWEQIERIGKRAHWEPRRALITGAGPVGLLGALLSSQRHLEVHVVDRTTEGLKPELVRALGATYGTTVPDTGDFDVIIECTAATEVVRRVMNLIAPDGILCLTGVSNPGAQSSIDLGAWNREMVLGNRVVFGSVNANRRHYAAAIQALAAADHGWLERLITRRVPLDQWQAGFEQQPTDIKTVIEL